MAFKSKKNRNLPPRMKARERIRKNGKVWIGYYYDGRDKNNNRIEIPLGTDLSEAKKKWAELEKKQLPEALQDKTTLGYLFDLYIKSGMTGLKPRTIKDYHSYIKQLRKVFNDAPIDQVSTKDIAGYRDARTAKVRANREITMLSIVYNFAIDKGLAEHNPAEKVKKNKEKARDYYAYDEVFYSVYNYAEQVIKDLMMVAYLTGQRPTDVRDIRLFDISKDHLYIGQDKTEKKLRIKLNIDNTRTELGKVIDDIIARKADNSPFLFSCDGNHLTYAMFRKRFTKARSLALNEALEKNDTYLADKIQDFQFKDVRPKAASDINDLSAASMLLGHTREQITKMVYIRKGQEVTPLNITKNNKDGEQQ